MAKKEMVCIVCGNRFVGNAHAETCSSSCRKKLSRMKAKGEKPTFALVAKATKKKEQPLGSKVKYAKATPAAYDSQKQSIIADEIGTTPPVQPKYIDKMNTPFWNELRKKKLGLKD